MKKLLMVCFIIAVFAMGIYDGGDATAGIVIGLLMLPMLLERKEKKNGQRISH